MRRIRPNYLGHHLSGALRLTHSFRGQLTIHATPQRHKKMHRSYLIHSPDRPGIEVHDWRTNAETTIGPPNITSYCPKPFDPGHPMLSSCRLDISICHAHALGCLHRVYLTCLGKGMRKSTMRWNMDIWLAGH